MSLFLSTENAEIRALLENQIVNHRYTDSGFDIPMISQSIEPNQNGVATLGFQIKAAATLQEKPIPFLILPRSSISSSPFRLTNSIGLIDMGYRGELKAKVDIVKQ
jgi:dUTP pyrophosphatase